MIRLEIYGETGGTLQVALYYPVPPGLYNPSSADQTRTPAGTTLTPIETQNLKEGRLVEELTTIIIRNKKLNELKAELEQKWHDGKEDARRNYKQNYSYIGRSWDGVWS